MKARCPDLAAAREIARGLGATDRGRMRQVDTYFPLPGGRLKLRETGTGAAELILYHRPDEEGIKASDYAVVPLAEAAPIRDLLAAALGVLVTVEKTRELWMLDNVRIHLDQVARLGSFLELEAVVDQAHDDAACAAAARELIAAFGIAEGDLVAGSYSDLLLANPS